MTNEKKSCPVETEEHQAPQVGDTVIIHHKCTGRPGHELCSLGVVESSWRADYGRGALYITAKYVLDTDGDVYETPGSTSKHVSHWGPQDEGAHKNKIGWHIWH